MPPSSDAAPAAAQVQPGPQNESWTFQKVLHSDGVEYVLVLITSIGGVSAHFLPLNFAKWAGEQLIAQAGAGILVAPPGFNPAVMNGAAH